MNLGVNKENVNVNNYKKLNGKKSIQKSPFRYQENLIQSHRQTEKLLKCHTNKSCLNSFIQLKNDNATEANSSEASFVIKTLQTYFANVI